MSLYTDRKNISKLNTGGGKQLNSFQHIPRRRFWWVIITSLYQLMLQSWYQKTAQSLVNTRNPIPDHELRACLHGGGGPQVGEVTRLAVVEKMACVYMQTYNPGVPGWRY